MKKLFAVMLIPFFLVSLPVISTEKDMDLSNEEKYHLNTTVVSSSTYFDAIPQNPILIQDSTTYKDADLTVAADTLSANTPLTITDWLVNYATIPVFKLSDGSYIEASRQVVSDDVVFSQEAITQDFWLNDGFTVYQTPYVTGTKSVKTDLTPYSKVTVTQKAVTSHGTYYKVDGKGWIAATDLSETDNRMQKVQAMLNQKYNKSNYSIYVKQLGTQVTAEINADKVMYSASVAKLATLYYVEAQLQKGAITSDDKLVYVDAVNHFDKSYEPGGSGKMSKSADNKEYTVDTLLKADAQYSDNVATNILGYYVAHQYDDDFNNTITAVAGTPIDMKERNMSAKTAANLMEAIYNQNGEIISYLSSTDFDSTRISKDIDVQVAHKIGDAYDYKHDVAIVYADQPFILSIFTNNASYDDITNIANDVYSILK